MEDIEKNILDTTKRISKLSDFIALSLRRNNISKELEQLNIQTLNIENLLTKAHNLMQLELNSYKYEYEEVMSEMRKKQIVLLGHVIKEKQRTLQEVKQNEEKFNLVFSCGKTKLNLPNTGSRSAVKQLGNNMGKLTLNCALSVTPKIKITEYKESPLVKKRINFPFQFEEFDVTITQNQFDSIPRYMCGRETLEQLNGFLETVIVPCFNEKYKLMHKDRSCLKNSNDLELWILYNEQASCLPGRTFITSGDINRKQNKMLDKKTQNRLVMLRHIGILNEVRVKQTAYYIWIYNGRQ